MARLTFLGVGDAVNPSGANTSLLYHGTRTLLLDCGPAIASVAFRALADPNQLDALWISHQHADHCFGLPTLLLMLRQSRRSKALEVLGGPGSTAILRQLLDIGYPGAFRASKCFPIHFSEISPSQAHYFADLRLTTAQTQHGVACHALRIDAAGHCLCFSSDGKLNDATLGLYREADLVVHECQSVEVASINHSQLAELQPLFSVANARQLALVHCSSHERAAVAERSRLLFGARAFVPKPGDTINLGVT